MAPSIACTSLKFSLSGIGMAEAALSALDQLGIPSFQQRARPEGASRSRESVATSARSDQGARRAASLPAGFVPLGEAKHLALLGRWPLLEDGTPACLPMKTLLAMRFRCEQGDRDADAWLKLFARAYAGEAEAQRLFGRSWENGACRAPADRQRAIFWYYRAALQGDAEAAQAVERLRRITQVSSAATAEPRLIYPGLWRITARTGVQVTWKSMLDLAADGTVSGSRLGASGVPAEDIGNALKPFAAPYSQSLFLPALQNVGYEGRWAYYDSRKILALDVTATAAGIPGSRSESWHIELTGCKIGALCGSDARGSSYILEYAVPAKNGGR